MKVSFRWADVDRQTGPEKEIIMYWVFCQSIIFYIVLGPGEDQNKGKLKISTRKQVFSNKNIIKNVCCNFDILNIFGKREETSKLFVSIPVIKRVLWVSGKRF